MKKLVFAVLAMSVLASAGAHAIEITGVDCASIVGIQEKVMISSRKQGSSVLLTTPLAPGQEFEIDSSRVVTDSTGLVRSFQAEGAHGGRIEIAITEDLPDANNFRPARLTFENKVQNIPDFRCSVQVPQ